MFGTSADAIVTRIERQMGGGRIPENLKTLPSLIRHLPSFDPFKAFELDWHGIPEPRPEDYDLTTYLAGIQLRHAIDSDGMQMTRKFVNAHTHGQAARFFKRYADFLPVALSADAKRVNLSDRFYFSVTNQLATVSL